MRGGGGLGQIIFNIHTLWDRIVIVILDNNAILSATQKSTFKEIYKFKERLQLQL